MDFCRPRPGWGRHHAESSPGIQVFRYSVAEPRPSLEAVKSRRDNVEIKSSGHPWELRNSWMDQETRIPLQGSLSSLGSLIGDAFPGNLKYSLPCTIYSLCCAFLHIYLYIYLLSPWLENPWGWGPYLPTTEPLPLKECWACRRYFMGIYYVNARISQGKKNLLQPNIVYSFRARVV